MVQAGDENLVPGSQLPADRPAELKSQRGHVRTHDDLPRRPGIQKVLHGFMGRHEDRITFPAGAEGPAMVGVGVGQVAGNRVDDSLRNLGAPRTVEKNRRAAGIFQGQGGNCARTGDKSMGGIDESPVKRQRPYNRDKEIPEPRESSRLRPEK